MQPEIIHVKNILFVEDDPRDVALTLAALEARHLANRVAIVDNGAEALDYLYRRGKHTSRQGGNPVLVLLDLNMPKIGGLEVLKIIKADENLKIIPVVVLTSSRETPDLVECYKHGVNAYVVKPVDFTEFMEAIRRLGVFWAIVNEPPLPAGREVTSMQFSDVISYGRKEVKNEIPTPHPSLGG